MDPHFFAEGEEGATWQEWIQQADTLLKYQPEIKRGIDEAASTFTFLIHRLIDSVKQAIHRRLCKMMPISTTIFYRRHLHAG